VQGPLTVSGTTQGHPASGPLTEHGRNPDLDGLRGLAALSVALGHCYEQVTGLALWTTSLRDFHVMPANQVVARVLSALFPSDAAVMVFFVLSGLVLWRSFERKNLRFFRDLPDYTAARLYRLLPLTIVTALPLGLLTEASARDLVRNMLLFSHDLNTVLWSLQAEVSGSAALFLVWGLTKGRPLGLLLALALSIAAVPFARGNPLVVFLPAFLLGAGIGLVASPVWCIRVWRSPLLLPAGLLFLLFSNVVLGHGGIDRCLEMAGATVLVGAVSHGRLPFLRGRLPLFLGAISYPFYLSHGLGLAAVQPILDRLTFVSPYPMIAARAILSIPPTILIAWLLHRTVELPAQRGRPRITWPSLRHRRRGAAAAAPRVCD